MKGSVIFFREREARVEFHNHSSVPSIHLIKGNKFLADTLTISFYPDQIEDLRRQLNEALADEIEPLALAEIPLDSERTSCRLCQMPFINERVVDGLCGVCQYMQDELASEQAS